MNERELINMARRIYLTVVGASGVDASKRTQIYAEAHGYCQALADALRSRKCHRPDCEHQAEDGQSFCTEHMPI
jgi:hypothetical protein